MNKILLVEDNEAIRSIFAHVLAREGYSVAQAATTEQGLTAVADPDVTVALIDIRLGSDERGGFRVARAADRTRTWLIAVSGSCLTDSDEVLRGIFDDVVEKPINFRELLAVTGKFFGRQR